jgi:Xaa-Pro aminopeptidase
LTPVTDLMVNQRKVKDAFEVAAIRKAAKVAEGAYLAVRPKLKAGMTENEIAGLMEFEMRRRGASSGSFETNVSVGANSALPHYRPADVPLRSGQALLFDWGAKVDYYCSDITRTHLFGRAEPTMREIYKVTLEAQLAAIAAIKPGAKTRAVDKVARDIIRKAGYGKDFGHGLGHGIGLAVHELPRLSPAAADEELRPGMICTVEPGIYLAGVGGVRIEDDVLVTETGCEVLTLLDKSYEGACLE